MESTKTLDRAFAAYQATKTTFATIAGASEELIEGLAIDAAAEELTPLKLRQRGLQISHDVAKVVVEVKKLSSRS